jgi:hypothetical protein
MDADTRNSVAKLARELENATAGKGFANLARLRSMGLIVTKEELDRYSRPNGRFIHTLTPKGQQMLTAASTVLLS